MSEQTPRLSLPYIFSSQAQKEITHNEALNLLDVLVQPTILNRVTEDPTALAPQDGDRYIVGAAPVGDWAGHAGEIACYMAGWKFVMPKAGWMFFDEASTHWVFYDGGAWAPLFGQDGSYLKLYDKDGAERVFVGFSGMDHRIILRLHNDDGSAKFSIQDSTATEVFAVDSDGTVTVGGAQVLTSRQPAIADAAGGATVDAEARTALNALLAACRNHGLIAT
ncbi:DUF2793 domain-containing protein [Luteithermobacter gelatinilyticus]|uniref:DUF2793 domain-containing protein n=1 Tax=Luteithermobacter gelatinilyticus TaxID=2582913 RepID=UPI00110681BB|nr:DUF2793 domain-containing protein [Luteithermobacter gelatinilyticus]